MVLTALPDGVDSGVRDLVREDEPVALKNEASGLGAERPLEPPALNRLAEIQVPRWSSPATCTGRRSSRPPIYRSDAVRGPGEP